MIRWFNRLLYLFFMFCVGVTIRDYFGLGRFQQVIALSILWAYFWEYLDMKKARGGTA